MSKVQATAVMLPRVPAGGPDEDWFEKATAAVERDRTLEARGLTNKVLMMAWDLGYELTAGNDPHHYKVEYEKLLLLADHLGVEAKARSEWEDGQDAGQENSAKTAKISSSDRHALIRLAASLPAGDETRRAILAGLKKASSHDLKQLQKWVAFGTPKFSKGGITRWLREMGCEEVQLYGPWNTRGNPYLEGTYAYNGKTYDVTFEKGTEGARPVHLDIHRDSDY